MSRATLVKYISYVLFACAALIAFKERAWLSAHKGTVTLSVMGFILTFSGMVIWRGSCLTLVGGLPCVTRHNPCLLTLKRAYQLWYSPLPSDIDVLWDGRVIDLSGKNPQSYKVRLVRSGKKWIVQRTVLGNLMVGMPVSTRCPLDWHEWETWYVAEGEWPATTFPPRVLGGDTVTAQWTPTPVAKKAKLPPLLVLDPKHVANVPRRMDKPGGALEGKRGKKGR